VLKQKIPKKRPAEKFMDADNVKKLKMKNIGEVGG
jgi:hypothetical protein